MTGIIYIALTLLLVRMHPGMEYPINMAPEQLDNYLAMGWFRMRQAMFTTHYLQFNNHFYSALWLRVGLTHYQPDKKEIQLRKLNSKFRVSIQPMEITEQHSDLFNRYRASVDFDMASSLQELLLGYKTHSPFDSRTVNIYDGDQLIAAGFFDVGQKAAAGIACIYHPDYRKYSQGKFLIYLKMAYCREQGMDFFYPGYFVPGYKPFDYKLDVGKSTLEFYDASLRVWLPHKSYSTANNPLAVMTEKLTLLHDDLSTKKISTSVLHYRFFDAPLDPDFKMHPLVDVPIFLLCATNQPSIIFTIITYNTTHKKFCVLNCSSLLQLLMRDEHSHIFSSDLLVIEQMIASSASVAVIAKSLKQVKNTLPGK